MNANTRAFLLAIANGEEIIHKADAQPWYSLAKDTGAVIKSMRIAANVPEGDIAKALGVDLEKYMAFEDGSGAGLEITTEGLKALAKAIKQDPVAIATQLIAQSGTTNTGGATGTVGAGGDQSTPPQGTTPPAETPKNAAGATTGPLARISKSGLESGQVEIANGVVLQKGYAVPRDFEAEQKLIKRRAISEFLGFKDETKLQKGLVAATDFDPLSTLTPSMASTIFQTIVDESALLKRFQTRYMQSTRQNVLVNDVAQRILARYPSATWPDVATGTQSINKSLTMTAQKMNCYFVIPDDTVVNFANNVPGFEAQVMSGFTMTLGNNVLDLSLNGIQDSNNPAETTFTHLGESFKTVALLATGGNSVPSGQIINSAVTPGTPSIHKPLTQIVDEMLFGLTTTNPRYYAEDLPIIISAADFEAYERAIVSGNQYAVQILVEGAKKMYRGHELITTSFQPSGTMLMGSLLNYILGLVNGATNDQGFTVERFRQPQGTLYFCTFYVDFEVINKPALTIAYPF
jgi:hypothetical protein